MLCLRLILASLALGGALGAVGCEKEAPPPRTAAEYTRNAKRDYDKALEKFFDRDWDEAIERFTEVKRNYGTTRYARLAELRIADARYHKKEYAEAVTAYRAFAHDFPNDPEVPYARFRVLESLFADTRPDFLLAPLEERDLVNVLDAYDAIRKFQEEFPGYKRADEVAYMLEVVTGLLARHELYVARFYLRTRKYEAALARVEHSLAAYPRSGLEPEALVLLGETYLRMRQPKRARVAFQRVLTEFPESAFVVPAQKFLERTAAAPAK